MFKGLEKLLLSRRKARLRGKPRVSDDISRRFGKCMVTRYSTQSMSAKALHVGKIHGSWLPNERVIMGNTHCWNRHGKLGWFGFSGWLLRMIALGFYAGCIGKDVTPYNFYLIWQFTHHAPSFFFPKGRYWESCEQWFYVIVSWTPISASVISNWQQWRVSRFQLIRRAQTVVR